jgi:hypothetical protein
LRAGHRFLRLDGLAFDLAFDNRPFDNLTLDVPAVRAAAWAARAAIAIRPGTLTAAATAVRHRRIVVMVVRAASASAGRAEEKHGHKGGRSKELA